MALPADAKRCVAFSAPDLRRALYEFTDINALADLWAGGINADHELVDEMRAMRRPFVAISRYRCRFQCPVCKVQTGDASYHYEDPRQPEQGSTSEPLGVLPPVSGRYVQVEYSVLHGIVAHGQPLPPALAQLFAEARRLSGTD